jgi:hypothetical protein
MGRRIWIRWAHSSSTVPRLACSATCAEASGERPTGGYRYRRFGWDGARFVLRGVEVLDEVADSFYR